MGLMMMKIKDCEITGATCLNCESVNMKWNDDEADVYCFDCGKWQLEFKIKELEIGQPRHSE